jgi:hypothetical protein
MVVPARVPAMGAQINITGSNLLQPAAGHAVFPISMTDSKLTTGLRSLMCEFRNGSGVPIAAATATLVNSTLLTCTVPPVTGSTALFVTLSGVLVFAQPVQGLPIGLDGTAHLASCSCGQPESNRMGDGRISSNFRRTSR